MSNTVWHIALKPGTAELQDVIVVDLEPRDFEMIGMLLDTKQVKSMVIETNGGGFMLTYGGEYERPYPSIIIWKLIIDDEEAVLDDMRIEDVGIIKRVWRDWLVPKDNTETFSPPGGFIVMSHRRQTNGNN